MISRVVATANDDGDDDDDDDGSGSIKKTVKAVPLT